MPTHTLIREYSEETFYHIYLRGVEKRVIFLDWQDKSIFLKRIERFMDEEYSPGVRIGSEIKINAYCLMDNHIHLMVYIKNDSQALTSFMRRVLISYVSYFNKKYDRVGPLFESKFKAKRVGNESYLIHLSRYIHLNPNNYINSRSSSIRYYLGDNPPKWLDPYTALQGMTAAQYIDFLECYRQQKRLYETAKNYLVLPS